MGTRAGGIVGFKHKHVERLHTFVCCDNINDWAAGNINTSATEEKARDNRLKIERMQWSARG